MKRRLVVIALAVASAVAFTAPAAAHPAVDVVDWIWAHVGGKEAYEKARCLEFTFAVEADGEIVRERRHKWDRYSGDYVLTSTNDAGEQITTYFNINTKEGVVVKDGEKLEDAEADPLIERAYAQFINDSYWLLMPVKLGDYGVRIRFDREEGQGHGEDQLVVLYVKFDEVGLTPGDQYWIYVKHDGQVVKWDYKLESGHRGSFNWMDEKDCGMGITLSTRKESVDGKTAIVFPHVRFSETLDPDTFHYASTGE